MKLPDFRSDDRWNHLRSRMGAPLVPFEAASWEDIDAMNLLTKLQSTGIEVDFPDITIELDGTFNFQGQKVLVYIKDQRCSPNYAGNAGSYKFHICNCKTIEDFRNKNQLERYVVSRRTDGIFVVNEINTVTREYVSKGKEKKMDVCKNCLMHLKYKGYSDHYKDKGIFAAFSLSNFFNEYQTSQFHTTPGRYSDDAIEDTYTPDFSKISMNYRAFRSWKCEECSLSLREDKGFLHVHHINGIKSDNKFSNLKALCLGCHSEQDGHARMKFTPAYVEFMFKYKSPWEGLRGVK